MPFVPHDAPKRDGTLLDKVHKFVGSLQLASLRAGQYCTSLEQIGQTSSGDSDSKIDSCHT